jgi:hypothetical protein
MDAILKPRKGGQKTEVTVRGPLRRQGATMDYIVPSKKKQK